MRLPASRGVALHYGSRQRLLASLILSAKPASLISLEQFETAKALAVKQKWPHALPTADFLQRGGLLPTVEGGRIDPAAKLVPVLDVRAPCEFQQGHIPGAISMPLFTDEERAEVGTLYKKKGHDEAVSRGLEIVTSKGWDELLANVPNLDKGDDVLVYCFRGGMRSGSVAWLLSQAPLNVHILEGGYKKFRRECHGFPSRDTCLA